MYQPVCVAWFLFFGWIVRSAYFAALLTIIAIGVSSCAEVQRIPGEVRYGPPLTERSEFTQLPLPEQKISVALRTVAVTAPAARPVTIPVLPASTAATSAAMPVTFAAVATAATRAAFVAPVTSPPGALRILEARLAEAPLCSEAAVERMEGTRRMTGKLGREDEIIMWSGYGGAALTALLVTIGMARGQEAGTGLAIFAGYGIPLAGVGAYETYRMWPKDEPVEPKRARVSRRGVKCPPGKDAIEVELVGGETKSETALSPAWKPLAIGAAHVEFSGETVIPALLRDGKLTAFLSSIPQAPVAVSAPAAPPSRPAAPAPLAVSAPVAAPVAPPAPVTAAASKPVRGCAAVAVFTEESGWLPKEFFSQPLVALRVEDGMSITKIAEDKLGGRAFVWQLHELNPGLVKMLDGPRPFTIQVPAMAQPAAYWKSKLPPLCE